MAGAGGGGGVLLTIFLDNFIPFLRLSEHSQHAQRTPVMVIVSAEERRGGCIRSCLLGSRVLEG